MAGSSAEADPVQKVMLRSAIPILRVFDTARAQKFYIDFLGFTLDWQHQHEPGFPLYMQVSRAGCLLHLSEHFGDATPGSGCFVPMEGVAGFCDELLARNPQNVRPELEKMPWGVQFKLTDPFGNKLTFCEQGAE
ncbi:glyoxalase superfamily protein [Shimia sp. MMG029]|uniref:glyoxalase superfamily protein n=1 Tax=Shimia sp. MMG029 TaxID=3021978 RepID=UPI0022FE3B82|nr:glyoxalase superfamily protein [Shimia sp. MMG029]MDA5555223.1 glyoxalase superfamily protein [Shimia sp. MMG029]